MFQDDAPDVTPSTEFTYYKKRRQEKAKKAFKNKFNEQDLQTMPHSPAQMETIGHDAVTKTSDEHISSTAVPSRPDGNLHCTSNVSTNDIEAVSSESQIERPSLTISIALGLLVVVTVVNIRFTFHHTAFI